MFRNLRIRQRVRQTGQSLAEYGLVVGLVAVAAIGSLQLVGGQVNTLLGGINSSLSNLPHSPPATALVAINPNSPATVPGQPEIFTNPGGTGFDSQAPVVNDGDNTTVTNNEPVTMPSSSLPSSAADDPQYQQWLAANPQTANLINQLSPKGQQVANELLAQVASSNIPGGAIDQLINATDMPPEDVEIIISYKEFLAGSIRE